MQYYFKLQIKLVLRRLQLFGISPLLGIPAIALGFFYFSNWIFLQTTAAPFIYLFLMIFFVFSFSSEKRNEFLQICFGKSTYKWICVLENLIISLPFVTVFLVQKLWLFSVGCTIISVFSGLISISWNKQFIIPTPFYKYPFEFILGFRKTYLIYLIVYVISAISVFVQNLNLCVFSVALFFFVFTSYYSVIEDPYIVWSYDATPKEFIREKLKIAIRFSVISLLPVFVLAGIFFFESLDITLIVISIGLAYLTTSILLKYAFFPNTDQLPRQLIFFVTIIFPPALIFTIPHFYKKSVQSLKFYLH